MFGSRQNDNNLSTMIRIPLPPALSSLIKTCETVCEAGCCGLDAFSFSPFNVIYHLTKWHADIRDEDVQAVRLELADLERDYGKAGKLGQGGTVAELNAIMTGEQISYLAQELASAISEACAIYLAERDRIEERDRRFTETLRRLSSEPKPA